MRQELRNSNDRSQRFIDLRTLAGLALTFASLVALLILVSCAPKPTERVLPPTKMDFGPLQSDPDLKEAGNVSAATVTSAQLAWNAPVDTSRVLRFAENLNVLGAAEKSPALTRLGEKIASAFYKSKGSSTRHKFEDSLYIRAAIATTKSDVMPILNTADKMLATQIKLLHGILTDTAASFKWPTAETPVAESIADAKAFGTEFLANAQASAMDRDVYTGIETSLKKDFFPLIDAMSADVDSILAEKRSVTIIHRIKDLAKKYGVDLGADAGKMLDQAETVMVDIEGIEKNHDALTVIVELWEMTEPANREKTFKPVAESLYNYLKNKSPHDLECIKSPRCLNPIFLIPKKIAILPSIEKYGLEKLKADLDKAAHDGIVKEITSQLSHFVPTLPKEIDRKIAEQIGLVRKKLADIKDDFPGFVKKVAREFARQDLSIDPADDVVHLKGLDAKRVNILLSPREISVKPLASDSSAFTSGSEVLGSSLAYAASLWASQEQLQSLTLVSYRKSVLSQINKMLSIGGFSLAPGKAYPSLAVSLDTEKPLEHFNAATSLSSKRSFAVPDSFSVKDAYAANFSNTGKNVSVRAQAELLRGLSSMVRYFRDWQKNDFDTKLGNIQVGKFIKDLPGGSIDQKLFPKETFFALALADGANILLNMTKKMTPVFLVDINNAATWANQRSGDDLAPATMAGLVDIVGGKRGEVVQTADTARFLLAVADFLDATNGIEKTKAGPLITPGADKKRPIDMLSEARSQLSQLIVGIANFISHEMADKDGGFRSTFHQDSVTVDAKEPRKAADQAICILALLKAGDVLGKKLYEWSALDAYAFMNRKLWIASKGFYSATEGSTDLPPADEIATILLAGEQLKTRMNDKSRDQWTQIATPWMKAFEDLAGPTLH